VGAWESRHIYYISKSYIIVNISYLPLKCLSTENSDAEIIFRLRALCSELSLAKIKSAAFMPDSRVFQSTYLMHLSYSLLLFLFIRGFQEDIVINKLGY
jgi:hypothetical protein